MFTLPELPYAYDALEPVLSDKTLHFHHDKHHANYFNAMNDMLKAAERAPESLEQVILEASSAGDRKMFNNAAQAWNHSFFWVAMSPDKVAPSGDLAAAIETTYGDLAKLKAAFVAEGVGHFGSGWVWLASDAEGALSITSTHDADLPLNHGDLVPLLVCDLWEHAYYLDHQNNRKGFLEAWFDNLANWTFATSQYAAAKGQGEPWTHPAPTA